MDAIVLRDKPTNDKCKDCSLTYVKNGIIINGIIHELVDNAAGKMECKYCSLETQCNTGKGIDICITLFGTDKCHFEIKQ